MHQHVFTRAGESSLVKSFLLNYEDQISNPSIHIASQLLLQMPITPTLFFRIHIKTHK